jgi:predicted permease
MDQLRNDFLHGLRFLKKSPVQFLIIVGTLGLAIGFNTALFHLYDQTILRPLPVEKPGELVQISVPMPPRGVGSVIGSAKAGKGGLTIYAMSYPFYRTLRDGAPGFQGILVYRLFKTALVTERESSEFMAEAVSGNYFSLLGIQAALGRTLTEADDQLAAPNPVAVISYGCWQRRFGGDTNIINRIIRVNNFPMTVIGVARAGFDGLSGSDRPDFFFPATMMDQLAPLGGGFSHLAPNVAAHLGMARLKPGLSREQAEKQADAFYRRLVADSLTQIKDPGSHQYAAKIHLQLFPGGYKSEVAGRDILRLARAVEVLWGMAGFVLLIAAANVANLLLARGAAQSRELAIQLALGASRWRLLRARLMENLMLASGGGLVGFFVSTWGENLLLFALPLEENAPIISTAWDWRMAGYTALIALATGLLIWFFSAVKLTHRSMLPPLSGSGFRPSFSPMRLRQGLTLLQVVLSVALVCAAALFAHSLYKLLSLETGFNPDNLLTFSIRPAQVSHDIKKNEVYFSQLLSHFKSAPGVESVSLTSQIPMMGRGGGTWIVGDPRWTGSSQSIPVDLVFVGPDFFRVIELPLLAGREFSFEDKQGSVKVSVVNEALARLLGGSQNAMEQRIGYVGDQRDVHIVGIASNTRSSFRMPARPTLFLPYLQFGESDQLTFLIRTNKGGSLTLAETKALVNRVDPTGIISDFKSMAKVVLESLTRDRMLALLSFCFGILAAGLSALGLFGLTSMGVTHRSREFGIRIALGADRAAILWLALREAVGITILGGVVGLLAYWGCSQALRSFLFELSPLDSPTLAAASILLALSAIGSTLWPAFRATRLDPVLILREE